MPARCKDEEKHADIAITFNEPAGGRSRTISLRGGDRFFQLQNIAGARKCPVDVCTCLNAIVC